MHNSVDTIYEGTKKRMFVFTLALIFLHILFLVEMIVLYPKLGPRDNPESEPQYSKLSQEESKHKEAGEPNYKHDN